MMLEERCEIGLRRWHTSLCVALIIAAGVGAYVNSFRGVFLFDDIGDIVNNAAVYRFWPPWECMLAPENVARPVVMLSLAANYTLGGTNPWGYHAFNLVIHILSTLLLFGIVRLTLRSARLRDRLGGRATPLALLVALLWEVHPLQTQAVTYVIQRFESLMAFFFLLTLYCFIRCYYARRCGWWYWAALAACAVGMACKQVMVTAPLLVFLYDANFLSGSLRSAAGRWRLHLGFVATWVLLAATLLVAPKPQFAGFDLPNMTSFQYARAQCGVILHYLRLAFWPDALCLDYFWRPADSGDFVLNALALGVPLGATALALWRWPAWGFLGAWFFLILAPTSSFLPLADLAFEHRMYLPLAALAAAVTGAGYLAAAPLLKRRSAHWAAVVGAALLLAALIWRTIARNEDYSSELRMWTNVVAQRPMNPRAYSNLGNALGKAGRLEDAAASYRRALQIKPDYLEAHYNLGNALLRLNRSEEAVASYRKALQIAPADAAVHKNLSVALMKLGRLDEATTQAREAAKLKKAAGSARHPR